MAIIEVVLTILDFISKPIQHPIFESIWKKIPLKINIISYKYTRYLGNRLLKYAVAKLHEFCIYLYNFEFIKNPHKIWNFQFAL